MDGASGSLTAVSGLAGRKRKRDFDEFMELGLLCVHSVVAYVILVASVALHQRAQMPSTIHDSDHRWKLLYKVLLSVFGQNPPRQMWAIPRVRSEVDDLRDWKHLGLSNRVDRFFRNDLRMSESSFNVLLTELEAHPLMAVSEKSFRASHEVSRKFMAWLKWVGANASYNEIDRFSGIVSGTLGKQGKRGHGVLGRVTLAMYDILVLGTGQKRPQGEIFFPRTHHDLMKCMKEFYTHARLPGVIGAVDGCLIQTPL
jgi:hypothetical protein